MVCNRRILIPGVSLSMMTWKIVTIATLMIYILASGCTETPNRQCDWIGPGGRAVYRCVPPS
jgi:hypothetical protein